MCIFRINLNVLFIQTASYVIKEVILSRRRNRNLFYPYFCQWFVPLDVSWSSSLLTLHLPSSSLCHTTYLNRCTQLNLSIILYKTNKIKSSGDRFLFFKSSISVKFQICAFFTHPCGILYNSGLLVHSNISVLVRPSEMSNECET